MNRVNDEMMISLARLISFQSVTGNKKEVTGALDACLSLCESMGLRTRKVENLLGYAEAGEGERLIGVLAHLDVVPAGEGWTTDPFTLTIKDGRAYGRGVSDDKGPAMAVVYAVKELLDEGKLKDKRVRIIFGCSEEDGEWDDIECYKAQEELPECGFTPDADFPLIYAEKGIANILLTMDQRDSGICELTAGEAPNMVPGFCHTKVILADGTVKSIDTAGKSAHGSTPEEGINAICLAMKEIDQMNHTGEACCRFADFYQNCFGDCYDGSLMECRLQDEQSGTITFNPGMANIEDGKVKLLIDVRYPVTFTSEQVMNKVSRACRKWNVKAELVYDELPMYAEKDSPLAETLLSAYRDVTGDMTPPLAMGGGTYAKAMDNILAFGPLFPGRECSEHQPDEYMIIEDLYKAREIYKLALERL